MKINYREPYWIKFEWDVKEHTDNQFVTNYNKHTNNEFVDFFHNKSFVISCNFKIEKEYKKDEISMVYGKPGKPMGLTYNASNGSCAFEYWVTNKGNDEFKYFHVKNVGFEDVENGVTITIIKKKNMLFAYKNFKEVNKMEIEGDFVEDYKIPELFLGCASPQAWEKKHRYFCEVDYNFFTMVKNLSNIEEVKLIHNSENEKLINSNYYSNILCLYNFKTINNIGIVYDDSKNTNFLERVPNEFIL